MTEGLQNNRTMKKKIEISKQLQEVYGNNRIVIGRSDGVTFVDIPDDPEVFADLMARLFATISKNDLNGHIQAFEDRLSKLISLMQGDSEIAN